MLRTPGPRNALIESADMINLVMPSIGEAEDYEMARKKKVRPMGYIIILVAILGLASGILYGMRGSLFGQEVEVPKIIGSSQKEAVVMLEEKGLKLKVVNRIHSDMETDHIISQRPGAGEIVKEGREIEVVISLGMEMVEVPNVVGETLEDASFILKNEGLHIGEVGKVNDPEVAEGIVVAQNPVKGRNIKLGERVT